MKFMAAFRKETSWSVQEDIDLNLARKNQDWYSNNIKFKNKNIKHISRNRRMRENRLSGSNWALVPVTDIFDPTRAALAGAE